MAHNTTPSTIYTNFRALLLSIALVFLLCACSDRSRSHLALPTPENRDMEAQLGIPVYPGAVNYGGSGTSAANVDDHNGMSSALLQTKDSIEDVVAFYTAKLTTAGPDGKPQPPLQQTLDNSGEISLSQTENGKGVKTAEIRQENDLTVIELMHISNAGSAGTAMSHGRIPGLSQAAPHGALDKTLSHSGNEHPNDQ